MVMAFKSLFGNKGLGFYQWQLMPSYSMGFPQISNTNFAASLISVHLQ
jgi:hypothetical protein